MIVDIYKLRITEIKKYNCCFYNLIRAKKIETKNISIYERNFKDFVIYFTRYVHGTLIKMLSLYYHELIGKIKEHEGTNI